MGREIRRVPKDWQHPEKWGGEYLPLYDEDYETGSAKYTQRLADFENDVGGDRTRAAERGCFTLEVWDGGPPDPGYYRAAWDDEPTHYQIYETVSEGTPTSPVFASLDEMLAWLIGEGYSDYAARKFVKAGWAPSMMFSPERGVSGIGIHSLDWFDEESDQ